MKYFNLCAKFRFLYFISIPSNHSLLRFWFYLRYENISTFYLTFTLLSLTFYILFLLLLTILPTCIWFYLRYKIRKIIQSSVLSFSDVLKVANFLLPSQFSLYLVLLGRKPVVWIFSTNYAKFFCLFLLWLCINVLCNVGECCESVPLDHTGSYISISINITRILACVVQVDAFYYQSLSWLHLHCNGSWLLVFQVSCV